MYSLLLDAGGDIRVPADSGNVRVFVRAERTRTIGKERDDSWGTRDARMDAQERIDARLKAMLANGTRRRK